MSRARELWREAAPLARRCLEHPFVRGLGDGTLERERYRLFIAQDAFFLEAFARGYAHCLARAPNREGVYAFRDLLDGVFEELELHRGAAAELDIDLEAVEPLAATLDYTNFLAEAIESGVPAGETLAAMTPCMRLYAHLGAELAPRSPAGNPYAEWVSTYAAPEFQDLAVLIESLFDRYTTGSEAERTRYQRAMELERAFFQAAYSAA